MTEEKELEVTNEEAVQDNGSEKEGSGSEKPKTLREIISDAYDETEKSEEEKDGEEKIEGRQEEVLKEGDKKPENTDPALKPLDTWPEDVKAGFSKLPKEYQEFLLKREKDRESYFTKTSQEVAPLRRVSQSFQPFLNRVQSQYNVGAEQVLGASLQTLQTLVYGTPQQKLAEWMNVAEQYGIPVGQQEQQNNEWVDPDIKALRDQNNMLMQKIQSIETGFLSKNEMEQRQAFTKADADIESFINAKTESGEPVNPFASDPRVLQEMAVLTKAYKAEGFEVPPLAELYNKAIYSLPDIREKVLHREKEAALQDFKKKNSIKLNQARNAASSITQQTYANSQFGKPKTTRQLIEEAWDEQSSNRV